MFQAVKQRLINTTLINSSHHKRQFEQQEKLSADESCCSNLARFMLKTGNFVTNFSSANYTQTPIWLQAGPVILPSYATPQSSGL